MASRQLAVNRAGPRYNVRVYQHVPPADERPGAGRELWCSPFGLTLNTNYRPRDANEATYLAGVYAGIINEVMGGEGGADDPDPDETVIRQAIKIVDGIHIHGVTGKKTITTHPISRGEYEEHIKYIDTDFGSEVGSNQPRGGRFHLHGYIFIIHSKKIQLDLPVIVSAINRKANEKGVPPIKYSHIATQRPGFREYTMKNNLIRGVAPREGLD